MLFKSLRGVYRRVIVAKIHLVERAWKRLGTFNESGESNTKDEKDIVGAFWLHNLCKPQNDRSSGNIGVPASHGDLQCQCAVMGISNTLFVIEEG